MVYVIFMQAKQYAVEGDSDRAVDRRVRKGRLERTRCIRRALQYPLAHVSNQRRFTETAATSSSLSSGVLGNLRLERDDERGTRFAGMKRYDGDETIALLKKR